MIQKLRLDRIFRHIIALLQKNARLSNKELATGIGLAPSSCLERVRTLEAAGIFRGFHASVDPAALGIGLEAMVAVRLSRHSRRLMEDFMAYVRMLPQVHAVYHIGGAIDFWLHVVARDTQHLLDFNLNYLSTRREIATMDTSIIFTSFRNPVLPCYLDE